MYRDLRKHEALPASGKGLLSTLYNRKNDAPHRGNAISPEVEMAKGPTALSESEPVATTTPSQSIPQTTILTMLEKLTYVQAVLWMAAHLADGLAHAHERGILHRDLKPANILLTDEGQPMLLDLDLFPKTLKSAQGTAAAIGGTLPYMSPEHLDAFRGGARPVDARSDLYSLGVILYELLAGRRPFEIPDAPPDRKLLDILIEGRLGTSPDVRRWNQTVTPAVESIIHHCLETDPQRRYQNARELSEDLERHLAHRPLKSAHEPSLRRAHDQVGQAPPNSVQLHVHRPPGLDPDFAAWVRGLVRGRGSGECLGPAASRSFPGRFRRVPIPAQHEWRAPGAPGTGDPSGTS